MSSIFFLKSCRDLREKIKNTSCHDGSRLKAMSQTSEEKNHFLIEAMMGVGGLRVIMNGDSKTFTLGSCS